MNNHDIDQKILKTFSSSVWRKESELTMLQVQPSDPVRPHTASGLVWEDINYAAAQDEPDSIPKRALTRSKAVRRRRRAASAPPSKRLSANVMPGKRESTYMEVLQTASQRGFQTPPRHEVSAYQKKSLPPTPPLPGSPVEGVVEMRDSVVSVTKSRPISQNAMPYEADKSNTDGRDFAVLHEIGPERFHRTSRFIEHFDDEPKPLIKASTWSVRAQRRDQGNQKWRDLAAR